MRIPDLGPAERDDQHGSEALARYIVDDGHPIPSDEAWRAMRRHFAVPPDPQNLPHMAIAMGVLRRERGAVDKALEFYRLNRRGHRQGFEAVSPTYSNYQVLAALAILRCPWAPDDLRVDARQFLRWDLAVSCLCATRDGVPMVPGGRVNGPEPAGGLSVAKTGLINSAHQYRVAATLGIGPTPVEERWWSRRFFLAAWPWRVFYGLNEELFALSERVALLSWVRGEGMPPAWARDIPVAEGMHVLRSPDGLIAWSDRLRSYGGGREGLNMALPLVVGRGGRVRAVASKPSVECERVDTWTWKITGGHVPGRELIQEVFSLEDSVELSLPRRAGESPPAPGPGPAPDPGILPPEGAPGIPAEWEAALLADLAGLVGWPEPARSQKVESHCWLTEQPPAGAPAEWVRRRRAMGRVALAVMG